MHVMKHQQHRCSVTADVLHVRWACVTYLNVFKCMLSSVI